MLSAIAVIYFRLYIIINYEFCQLFLEVYQNHTYKNNLYFVKTLNLPLNFDFNGFFLLGEDFLEKHNLVANRAISRRLTACFRVFSMCEWRF